MTPSPKRAPATATGGPATAAAPKKAAPATKAAPKKPAKKTTRRAADPAKAWASYLRRYRPGLQGFILAGLTAQYGEQRWHPSRLDPTSELILTILTQNTADTNAEKAYEALRVKYPSNGELQVHTPDIGWGGAGLSTAPAPDWTAVEHAPLPELIDVIRPGGLAPQKAPRLQATLRHIREQRGDYNLDFLGQMAPLEARDWLTGIDGIGKKTASIVLSFCFGMPLMAVDRHVERVSKRLGLIPDKATADQAHDLFLELLAPEEMYAGHVLLIHHGRELCHAQNPKHDLCPLRDRCRAVEKKAP